jgi:Putative addiction module component
MKVLSDIAKEALDLPPAQRQVLARVLLDLSEDDQDFSPEVEAAWEEEICRRMKSVTSGLARARSFDAVFADLDRRFGS